MTSPRAAGHSKPKDLIETSGEGGRKGEHRDLWAFKLAPPVAEQFGYQCKLRCPAHEHCAEYVIEGRVRTSISKCGRRQQNQLLKSITLISFMACW